MEVPATAAEMVSQFLRARSVREEPGNVALQGLAALDATKQGSKRLEEGGEFGQGIGGNFGYCNWYVHIQQLTTDLTN